MTLLTAIGYVFGIAACSIALGGGLVCLGFGLHEQDYDMKSAGFFTALAGLFFLVWVCAEFLISLDAALRVAQ